MLVILCVKQMPEKLCITQKPRSSSVRQETHRGRGGDGVPKPLVLQVFHRLFISFAPFSPACEVITLRLSLGVAMCKGAMVPSALERLNRHKKRWRHLQVQAPTCVRRSHRPASVSYVRDAPRTTRPEGAPPALGVPVGVRPLGRSVGVSDPDCT